MASITIRNIGDDVKHALRVEAARNGTSMEEHARRLLTKGLIRDRMEIQSKPLSHTIARILDEAGGGVVLEPYPDQPVDFARLDRGSLTDRRKL